VLNKEKIVWTSVH